MTDDIRQGIINSLCSRRGADGVLEDNYVSHIKIYEEEEGGSKSRYILLSVDRNGLGHAHKTRQNPNGSFSIGKSWKLEDLRAVEVFSPTSFKLSFARSYKWSTDKEIDQVAFLGAVVRLFRQVTDNVYLNLVGYNESVSSPTTYVQSPGSSRSDVPLQPNPVPISSPNRKKVAPVKYAVTNEASFQNPTREPPPKPNPPVAKLNDALHEPRPRRTPSKANLPNSRSHSRNPHESKPSLDTVSSQTVDSPSSASVQPTVSGNENKLPSESNQSYRTPKAVASNNAMSRTLPVRQEVQMRLHDAVEKETEQMGQALKRAETEQAGIPNILSRHPQPRSVSPQPSRLQKGRHDTNPRISVFDPQHQSLADNLLGSYPTPTGYEDMTRDEDPSLDGTLIDVEEMLEGIEWGGAYLPSRETKKSRTGAADMIEENLTCELVALEKANIHSFLEYDERIVAVLAYMDAALAELDNLEGQVSSYKIHLNAVGDDISHVESQDRGVQVQTQNQNALVIEIKQLLETLDVDREALLALSQESLENSKSIQKLEWAAGELYKALVAGRETGMAATIERLEEYHTHNSQFCKRLVDFLSIAFNFQAGRIASITDGTLPNDEKSPIPLPSHKSMENYLERYCGLMMYLKEMDEGKYSKVAGLYFSTVNELHSKEIKTLFMKYMNLVHKVTSSEADSISFDPPPAPSLVSKAGVTVRRAKTIARSPAHQRDNKGKIEGHKALKYILDVTIPQIQHEESFITDFFSIADFTLTFADWMQFETYFRRKAAASAKLSQQTTIKLVRGGMELVFGFLYDEFKIWIDGALQRDPLQIVGILGTLERTLRDTEDNGNIFMQRLLFKLHQRVAALCTKHFDEQMRSIEQTKFVTQKRGGIVHCIRYFPIYVENIETQLIECDKLKVRRLVNSAYQRLVEAIFESLQHLAKIDSADARDIDWDDKGQLNYHVTLIENTHYFLSETSNLDFDSILPFLECPRRLYDENLASYVKLVLKKPMMKTKEYFDGLEHLLQTTDPAEVSNNSNYSRLAMKRILKDLDLKDMRRHIDTLFKRLQKHFDHDIDHATDKIRAGSVTSEVWKACETEVLRETERFDQLIQKCYAGSGLGLEYSVADIEISFRRHKV